MRVGETIWNTLKWGGTEEGMGNKDFKKGGKLGQGVSALKRGLEPLTKYAHFFMSFK